MGLAAVMAARIVNCDPIIVVDVMPERLALALELGATNVIDASKDGLVEAIRRIRPAGVAYALESTGNPSVLRAAFEILHTRGICGLIGGSKIGTEASLEAKVLSHLWLNGKLVHTNRDHFAAIPERQSVKVQLKKGVNRILFKINNGDNPHGFYMTILSEQELKTTALK